MDMENVSYHVDRIHRMEESISMLYDAARKICSIGDDAYYHESIKAQEEKLREYCQSKRNEWAAYLRENGEMVGRDETAFYKSLGFHGGGSARYQYDGDEYVIYTDFDGNAESIVNYSEQLRRENAEKALRDSLTVSQLRCAAGMTQREFSEYFGIPKRTVENWDAGVRKCPGYLLDLMRYKLTEAGLFFPD